MVVFHLQIFWFAYRSEKYFAWLFKEFSTFKDLSLEFKNLPRSIDSEAKVKEFFDELSCNAVMDVCCVYDMSKVHELEEKIVASENACKILEKTKRKTKQQNDALKTNK